MIEDFMKWIFSLCLVLFSTGLWGQEKDVTYLEPEAFHNSYNMEIYAIIADARKAKEFRKSRIPKAVSVPKMKKLVVFADSMDVETPVYIYCDGEARSRTVAEWLGDYGFTKLYILKGGFTEWVAVGMTVERKR